MTRTLKKILGTAIISISLLVIPYSRSYAQMTGSTTYGSKQDPNLRNKIPRYNPKLNKFTEKILGNVMDSQIPFLYEITKGFSKKYGEFTKKTGNVTGTGRTTAK